MLLVRDCRTERHLDQLTRMGRRDETIAPRNHSRGVEYAWPGWRFT